MPTPAVLNFPALEPTTRSFTAPTWPINSVKSQSGMVNKRLWGNRPSRATLSMTFENILDAEAAVILNVYNQAKGSLTQITLPSAVVNGMDSALTLSWSTFIGDSGLLWHFSADDPPAVESISQGRSTVRVNLVAELTPATLTS